MWSMRQKPFIVNLTHHGGDRAESIDDPMATVTGAHRGEKALVTPFVTGVGGRMGQTEPRSVSEPVQTLTAKADSVVVTPFISAAQQGGSVRSVDGPLHTVTASPKDQNQVAAVHLTKFRANSIGSGMDEPAPTVTANSFIKRAGGAAPLGVVAASLVKNNFGDKPHYGADEPVKTITTGGHHALVAAFLAQNNIDGRTGEGNAGRPVDEPVSTILQSGSHQGVAAVNLVRQFGTAVGSSVEEPAPTVMPANGGGGNKSQLSAAFLQKYYGADQDPRLD
jgi:DNA (cytosine-5)-methyltransferase 1